MSSSNQLADFTPESTDIGDGDHDRDNKLADPDLLRGREAPLAAVQPVGDVLDMDPVIGDRPDPVTGKPVVRPVAADGGDLRHVPPSQTELDPPDGFVAEDGTRALNNMGRAAHLLGRDLQNLPMDISDPTHHGTNARFVLKFFSATSAGDRRAALAGLKDQILNHDNASAVMVFKELSLVDAAQRLKSASPGSREQKQALLDLALLEEGENQAGRPGLLDTIYPNNDGLITAAERTKLIENARAKAAEIRNNPEKVTKEAVETLSRPDATTEQREDAMDQLSRSADWHTGQSGRGAAAWENVYEWARGMKTADNFRSAVRDTLADPLGKGLGPADSLLSLLSKPNDPASRFVIESMQRTEGGRKIIDAAFSGNRNLLEKALNASDVPLELKEILQGAELVRKLTEQLGSGRNYEKMLLATELKATAGGAKVLEFLQKGDVEQAIATLSDPKHRADVRQTMNERRVLSATEHLLLDQSNPNTQHIHAQLLKSPAGKALIEAYQRGDLKTARGVLADPKKLAEILKVMAPLAAEQKMMARYMKPLGAKDFLEQFSDPEMVKAARKEAQKFAEDNWKAAEKALADGLERKEPQASTRKDAIAQIDQLSNERFEKLAVDNLGGTVRYLKATDYTTAVFEAKTPSDAAAALSALVDESSRGNHEAGRFLSVFGSQDQIKRLIENLNSGDATSVQFVKDVATVQSSTKPTDIANALDRLLQSAAAGNEAAKDFFKETIGLRNGLDHGLDKGRDFVARLRAEDSEAYREVRSRVPSAVDELNDLRTRRILRGLEAKSAPADYQARIEQLKEEAEKHGNRSAADWLKWAETSQQLAALSKAHEATNPQQAAADAMKRLNELADKGNPYARSALTNVLAAGAERERQLDFYAAGNGEVGRDKDKPLFMPDVSKLPEIVRSEIKLSAMAGIEKLAASGHKFSKEEYAGMALAFSESKRLPAKDQTNPLDSTSNKRLDERIGKLLTDAVAGEGPQRSAAMLAMADILKVDFDGNKGTNELADIFAKGGKDPVFRESFAQFNRWATGGHGPALRIVAAAAGGVSDEPTISRTAKVTIENFGLNPTNKEVARDVLVHAYRTHGDKYAVLETLGKLTRFNDNITEDVRAVLRDGLNASEKKGLTAEERDNLRRSAVSGMMEIPDKWQAADVKLLTAKLTPDVVEGLKRTADKIPENVQREIFAEVMNKVKLVDGAPHGEAEAALQVLRSFAKHATKAEVDALVNFGKTEAAKITPPELALKFEYQTAVTILAVMTKGSGDAARAAYLALGPERNWHGMSKNDIRGALIDYAKGRPTDLDTSKEVSMLIYDAGIRRPTAGIFKDLGIAGSDAEQFALADEAVKKVQEKTGKSKEESEQIIRDIMAKVDLYNGLPDNLKSKLSGTGGPLDGRMVVGMIANGTLFDASSPGHFLTGDLEKRVRDLKSLESETIASVDRQVKDLERQRQDTLRELGAQTKEGVDIFDRIGHVGVKLFTLGQADSSIDEYAAKQKERVNTVRALEERMKEIQKEKSEPGAAVTFYSLAQQNVEWAKLMQEGKTKEADDMAVRMWGEHGDQLKNYSPAVWYELTRTGNRPIDRNVWQRLRDNGYGQLTDMPEFRFGELAATGGNPKSGLEQGLKALQELKSGKFDTVPIRNQALQAVDSDPNFAKLVKASGSFAQDMSALFGNKEAGITGMFEAGLEGTKYETFVEDARRRAGNIKRALDSITQDDVDKVKAQIVELRKAASKATDSEAAAQLRKRASELENVVKIFDTRSTENPSMRQQIERMVNTVQSGKFDENTFVNWLKKEGIVYAIAIAAAVATVATMGAASPLLVAAAASGVAIIASEVTKEVLFHADIGLGPGEQSRLGNYFAGKPEIDPETGRERPRELFKDVIAPYAKQWAMDTLICLGTMGVGHLASKGINALGSNAVGFLARHSGKIARMQASMKQITAQATDPARKEFIKKTLKEFADESFDEFKEEMAQTTIEKGLARGIGKNSEVLSFVAASLVATGKGVNFHRVRGTNFVGIDVDSSKMGEVMQGYEKAGAKIIARADGVSYEVKMPDGGKWVVAPKAYLNNTLPDASTGPKGDPVKQAQKVGETDTPTTMASEATSLGDANWSPTADGIKARQDMQKFAEAMAKGDYKAALEIAQSSGVGPKPGNVTDTKEAVKIDAADLQNPVKVREFLARMQAVGQIVPGADNAGKAPADRTYEVTTPKPVVKLGSGAEVDLTNPDQAIGNPPRALTDSERASVQDLLKSDAVQRILQEQAMITMEERLVHLSQLHAGTVISPTYAKFLAERGRAQTDTEQGDAYYNALKAGKPGSPGRPGMTYEQELIAMLYDAGMPLKMIEHHFGSQHGAQRKPIIDYLKAREAGADTRARPGDTVVPADTTVRPGEQPVLRRTPEGTDASKNLTTVKAIEGIDGTRVDEIQAKIDKDYANKKLPEGVADALKTLSADTLTPDQANILLDAIDRKLADPDIPYDLKLAQTNAEYRRELGELEQIKRNPQFQFDQDRIDELVLKIHEKFSNAPIDQGKFNEIFPDSTSPVDRALAVELMEQMGGNMSSRSLDAKLQALEKQLSQDGVLSGDKPLTIYVPDGSSPGNALAYLLRKNHPNMKIEIKTLDATTLDALKTGKPADGLVLDDPSSFSADQKSALVKADKLAVANLGGFDKGLNVYDFGASQFAGNGLMKTKMTELVAEVKALQAKEKGLSDQEAVRRVLQGGTDLDVQNAAKALNPNAKVFSAEAELANKKDREKRPVDDKITSIYNNLIEPLIDIESIQGVLDSFNGREQAAAAFMLLHGTQYYSYPKLMSEMRNLKGQIEKQLPPGKTMNDVVIVTGFDADGSSYMMQHMFGKANGLTQKNFVSLDDIRSGKADLKGKTLVYLDDFSCSGKQTYDNITANQAVLRGARPDGVIVATVGSYNHDDNPWNKMATDTKLKGMNVKLATTFSGNDFYSQENPAMFGTLPGGMPGLGWTFSPAVLQTVGGLAAWSKSKVRTSVITPYGGPNNNLKLLNELLRRSRLPAK